VKAQAIGGGAFKFYQVGEITIFPRKPSAYEYAVWTELIDTGDGLPITDHFTAFVSYDKRAAILRDSVYAGTRIDKRSARQGAEQTVFRFGGMGHFKPASLIGVPTKSEGAYIVVT
jgi:hypothetical protein